MKKKTNIIEKIRAISDSADVEQLIENSVINAGLDWIIERSVLHSEICDGDPDGTNKIGEIVKFNSLGGYTCGLSKFEENEAVQILMYWLFEYGKKRDLFNLYRAFTREYKAYIDNVRHDRHFALNNATISKGLITGDHASIDAYSLFKRQIESDLIIPIINQVFVEEIQEYVNEEE